MKKHVLGTLLLALLSNSMNSMDNNQPGAWNRFKTWLFSSPRDIAERRMPQVPAHPVYPKDKEIEGFNRIAVLDENHGFLPRSSWERPKIAHRLTVNYRYPFSYSYNPDGIAYSDKAPTREDIQDIERSITDLNIQPSVSKAYWKRVLAEERSKPLLSRRNDMEPSWERWLDESRRLKMAAPVRRRLLEQYKIDATKWLDKKDKVLAQQAQMKAQADYETQKRRETYKRIISSLGNE